MFRGGGAIDDDGIVDDPELDRLMRRLAILIEARSRGLQDRANAAIPAGYTYLLQFIAHDLVDSVQSPQAAQAVLRSSVRNGRSRGLVLDTLYGTGSDEAPHAYEFNPRPNPNLPPFPRTRLRVGARSDRGPDRTPFCPMRDIGRTANTSQTGSTSVLCDPLLADPRNDAHVFVSQITVLFQLLHNHLVDLLDGHLPPPVQAEDAYRRYLSARLAVTLIYRNIIIHDVLHKILDKRVAERYRAENWRPLLDGDCGVPIEFSHGAFRFGHAMVRSTYQVSHATPLETLVALHLSSAGRPARLPVKGEWLVDWARFFEIPGLGDSDARTPNASLPIGPHYSPPLRDDNLFPGIPLVPGTRGLQYRDLLSGCYAGLLSVPTLCRRLSGVFGTNVAPDFDIWRPILLQWLSHVPAAPALQEQLEPDDIARLAGDPPLLLFVLLEAECGMMDGQCTERDSERGQCLGPVGSIIVAETVLGAIAANPILSAEDAGASLQERIARSAAGLFPNNQAQVNDALSSIDEIASMADLLKYLERKHVFAPAA